MNTFDPYPAFATLTLRQLAEYFGVTSHVVGRWLKEIDFRNSSGEPTQRAIEAGAVQTVRAGGGARPFWAWDKERALRLLEAAGHQRLGPPQMPPPVEQPLVGPFASHNSDPESSGFEICDSNGITAIWCRGEILADRLVKLLNLCHANGKWFV